MNSTLSPFQALMPRAFMNLAISYDLFSQRLERAMRPMGLNMTIMSLLSHFSWQPTRPSTISELVKVMGIHQPGITKSTKTMLDKGWLRREVDENDARIRRLYITEQGLLTLRQAQALTLPIIAEVFASFDEIGLTHLVDGLEKMKGRLEETR